MSYTHIVLLIAAIAVFIWLLHYAAPDKLDSCGMCGKETADLHVWDSPDLGTSITYVLLCSECYKTVVSTEDEYYWADMGLSFRTDKDVRRRYKRDV